MESCSLVFAESTSRVPSYFYEIYSRECRIFKWPKEMTTDVIDERKFWLMEKRHVKAHKQVTENIKCIFFGLGKLDISKYNRPYHNIFYIHICITTI